MEFEIDPSVEWSSRSVSVLLLGWVLSLYVWIGLIIGLKGVWIVPLKSRINLQARLGPLLKIQRRIIFARLVLSGKKTQNICR